jgi:hypothetical protein
MLPLEGHGLQPIDSFGLTCTSGLWPALGGAPWAYALIEKQTAIKITRAFIHFPFAFGAGTITWPSLKTACDGCRDW